MYRYRFEGSTSKVRERFDRVLAKLGHIVYVKGYRYLGRYNTYHEAVFVRGTHGTARFGGLCWGYGGEGPHGTEELLKKLGLTDAEAAHFAFKIPRRGFSDVGPDWEVFFGEGDWYANCECEGTHCSVGPFQGKADADLFRKLMFNRPHGDTSMQPTGREMTVREFQDMFRADFLTATPPHWNAA